MCVYSVGDLAAHLTRACGEYVSANRVVAAIDRLIESGALADCRAGRDRVVLDTDLAAIEAEFGITGAKTKSAVNIAQDEGGPNS